MTLLQHQNDGPPVLVVAVTSDPAQSRYARQVVRLVPDLTNSERESLGIPAGQHVPPFAAFHHSNN